MISNKGKAGRRGQFVKGDPRINRDHGPRCAEAAAWSINGANALAKEMTPKEWASIVAKKARAGAQWALELYAEIFIQKAAQRFEHSGEING